MHATKNVKNNTQGPQAVQVVALALQRKSDHRYLLARRGPGQSGAGEWEFPGGKIEIKSDGQVETQTEALKREIQEELSLSLDEHQFVFVADNIHQYQTKSVHLFLWKLIAKDQPEIKLSEHDQVCWCSPVEMQKLGISAADRPFIHQL